MTTTIQPNDSFEYIRPDEVAECWDGVDMELYAALWNAMSGAPELSDFIDIENSAPSDAIGINTVDQFWDRFTPAQQARLNELAELNDGGRIY